MKNPKIYSLPFRRKREGRTNYRKRLKLLSSDDVRMIVRKSLNNIVISFARYGTKGDIVELTLKSDELEKFGWKIDKGNVPSAYLLGYLAGKKANEKGINKAIVDIGLNPSIRGSRLYAAVAGAIDAGLEVPFDKESLPPKERLNGTHISKYAELLLKNDNPKYSSQFSGYIKNNIDPAKIPQLFIEAKDKILKR